MNKERILVVTVDFPPIPGGMSEHAFGIVNGLSDRGHEVFVLAPRGSGYTQSDRDFRGKKVYYFPFSTSLVSRIIILTIFCFFILLGNRIKIVVNNTWSPCGVASYLVSHLLKIRYFIYAHGLDILEPQRSSRFTKWMCRVLHRSDGILAVSRFTAREVEKLGIPQDKISVVPNGVDPLHWHERSDPAQVAEKYGLRKKTVVLTVSRLVKRKGHDFVLRALKELCKEFPDLVYLIVGDGPERKRLEVLVEELHLQDRVFFAGFVKDEELKDYYALCNFFILTPTEIHEQGDAEGFGIVYLEANLMGKAVIGSCSGGIRDAVVDGETGLLVPPGDPKAIQEAMRRLLKEREYQEKLGRNGRERVLREYTWDRIASRLQQIICA